MITVLLVDDSDFMRNRLKETLKTFENIKIIEGHDFDSGLSMFKSNNPDICFFDIVIGEKNGIDLLKAVKEINKNVRVIMLSSAGQKKIIEKALHYGASDFLDKPFEPDDVKAHINQIKEN